MKKVIFLAHDPGGYDVISPVAEQFRIEKIPSGFFCIGPAAKMSPLYQTCQDDFKQKIEKLIKENAIAVLVTGTSWGNQTEVNTIELCKKNHIKTISILDYWSNYAMRFCKDNGEYVYPDQYFVIDGIAKQEAISDGVPEGILEIVGQPGLDKYVSYAKKCKRENDKIKQVLFLSQPLSLLYGKTLGYTEQMVLRDVVKIIKKYGYQLKVKFHPKDEINFQKMYKDIAVQGNLMDIMTQYDLIIGMSTMGLLHAVLMGIDVISYQPGLCKPDGCITNKLGMTKSVDSYLKLDKRLLDYSISNRKMNLDYIWMDGESTKRVVMAIKRGL